MRKLRIGTTSNKFALWRADFAKAALQNLGLETEIIILDTNHKLEELIRNGEAVNSNLLSNKAIEEGLLSGEADLAVFSMKTMPIVQAEGLVLTAVSHRENPAAWLVATHSAIDTNETLRLCKEAMVGTSTFSQKVQLLDFRPDLKAQDIPGDIFEQLDKLKNGDFDAILLDASDIQQLEIDLSAFVIIELHPREFVPTPAQGVWVWQTHINDTDTRRILKQLHHRDVSACTNVERKLLQLLGGTAHRFLGAYCFKDTNNYYHVTAAFLDDEGIVQRINRSSSTTFQLAELLLADISQRSVNAI